MTNTLKWLRTFTLIVGVGFNSFNIYPLGPSYNVFRGYYMGNRRVYVARILYNYHKPSINNGFLIGMSINMGIFS